MRKLLLTLLIIMAVGSVSASFISISASVTSETVIFDNMSEANLTLVNSGDEPAYDVFVSFLSDGLSGEDIFFGRLDPEKPETKSFILDSEVSLGSYVVPFLVEYKDANGHLFSAVNLFSVAVERPAFSHVTVAVSRATVSNKPGELEVTLKNLDDEERVVELSLLLPNELSCGDSMRTITLDPKSEETLYFQVSSLDALAGSSYALFAVASYEDEGLYHSSFASNLVDIVSVGDEKPDSFSLARENLLFWVFAALVLLLLAAFLFFQFRG